MFCINCGTKVKEESKFCHACGTQTVNQTEVEHVEDSQYDNESTDPVLRADQTVHESDQKPHNNTSSYEEAPRDQEDDDLVKFVGKNAYYYKMKWAKMKNPASSISWNWPAFFLGPFWLGYRKMYLPIFILVGVYALLDTIDTFMGYGYNSSAFTNIVSFGTWVLLGLFGNALYYRHATKKIKNRERTFSDGSELRYMGGTSGKGIFVTIGAFALYFLYLVIILSLFVSGIVFGTGESFLGVIGVKDTFSPNEAIYYEVDFGTTIDSYYVEIEVLRDYGQYEEFYFHYEEMVDPSWTGFYNEFHDPYYYYPLERGNYIVRAYRYGELMSEGTFSIR